MKKTWASRVLSLRKRLGLTQETFAQRLGVSFVSVSRWENGAVPGRLAQMILEQLMERARREAKEAVQRALDDVPPYKHGVKGKGLERWEHALNTVGNLHGVEKRKRRERLEFDK